MERDGYSCARAGNAAAHSKVTPASSLASFMSSPDPSETNVDQSPLDGYVGRALPVLHRIHGVLLEIGIHGKDERGRAHELVLRAQSRRLAALLDFVPGF